MISVDLLHTGFINLIALPLSHFFIFMRNSLADYSLFMAFMEGVIIDQNDCDEYLFLVPGLHSKKQFQKNA